MKLRTKISLVVLPVVAGAIMFLGLWNIRSSESFFVELMFDVLAKDLDVYVGSTLEGLASGLEEPASLQAIEQAQLQAFKEAKQEYTLETGHFVIVSLCGQALLCSRDYSHHQAENVWRPLVEEFVAHKLLPPQDHSHHNASPQDNAGHLQQQASTGAFFEVSNVLTKGSTRMLQGQATINGEDALYVATHFKPWNWVVVSTISRQEINNAIAGLRYTTLWASLATIGITFILICIAMRRFIARPISLLQEAALVVIGQGHVEQVAIDSQDELGSLARSMEVLSIAQQRYQEYQTDWQERLEQKVADRTTELQQSNEALNNEVSQRRKTNEQYQRLLYTLDQTLDSVFMFRPSDLRFSYVNRGGTLQVGYSKEELLEMTPVDIKPEFDQERFRKLLAPLVSGEKKFLKFETVHLHKNGQQVPVEILLQYVAREEENGLFISIVRDISARKKAEAETKDLQCKLQQAHKMEAVGTLAGGIAHDFNNILASIIGFAELARDQVETKSPVRDDIEQVLLAGQRAKELVRQILAFSRQSNDEKFPVYPQHIIKETLQILRATLPSSVEIRTEISDECPKIVADPTQIHQVLLNLCVNGVHAMDDKGWLTIGLHGMELTEEEVSAYPGVEPGLFVCLSVADSGSGISDAVMTRIFDPFFTTKAVGEGTGMGLAMVHGIVKDHGGMIKVASSLGQGATFTVFLPASTDVADIHNGSVPAEAPLDLAGVGHILVVDDEVAITGMYKKSLESRGYKVTVAHDGQQALDLFRTQPDSFDMLITDQTMPQLTGTELVKKVLTIRSGLPVILCSGYSSSIDSAEIHELGIRRYLYKPMDLKVLAKEVREILADQVSDGQV